MDLGLSNTCQVQQNDDAHAAEGREDNQDLTTITSTLKHKNNLCFLLKFIVSIKMALPVVHALEDCADFSTTVKPFIPQLYELPAKLLDVFAGRESLLQLYTETNPLISGFAISVVLGAVFLVVAEINRNYSQVDRCWSLLPTVYIAHFDAWARLTGIPSRRIDAALLFSTIWSVSGTCCTPCG